MNIPEKYQNVKIDSVLFIPEGGMLVQWSDKSLGFGEVLFWNNGSKVIDSECMSKEFCMAIMAKLIDESEIK